MRHIFKAVAISSFLTAASAQSADARCYRTNFALNFLLNRPHITLYEIKGQPNHFATYSSRNGEWHYGTIDHENGRVCDISVGYGGQSEFSAQAFYPNRQAVSRSRIQNFLNKTP